MTVLGRGPVFQQVLVTQTCTYNSNNIVLQNIGITDFPSKSKIKNKTSKKIFFSFKEHTNSPPPPPQTRPKKKKKKKATKEGGTEREADADKQLGGSQEKV